MGTIKALRKGLQSIQLERQIVKIIDSDASTLIQYNQNQLYKSGEDSLGVKLPAYKSKVYAAEKVFKNPGLPFGQPDLKLTGSFYAGFTVSVGYTGIFTIDSRDSKTSKLEAKYGITIFGLNKANKTLYATGIFYDKLKSYISNQTGLIFR